MQLKKLTNSDDLFLNKKRLLEPANLWCKELTSWSIQAHDMLS